MIAEYEMKVIGITGGVGSGKSQVLGYLEKTYKAKVCQLDEVAKELQKSGKPCFQKNRRNIRGTGGRRRW